MAVPRHALVHTSSRCGADPRAALRVPTQRRCRERTLTCARSTDRRPRCCTRRSVIRRTRMRRARSPTRRRPPTSTPSRRSRMATSPAFTCRGTRAARARASMLVDAFGERALRLDVPACTHGIDIGAEPTPLERAETLAADLYGAARTWFLVNGASQGNHALCLALAQVGRQRRGPAQRPREHGERARSSRACSPTFVAPEIDVELGVAHCVTPEALEQALDETPERRRRIHRLARRTTARSRTCARSRDVAHAARRAADRRRGLGGAPRTPRGPAASTRSAGADYRASRAPTRSSAA